MVKRLAILAILGNTLIVSPDTDYLQDANNRHSISATLHTGAMIVIAFNFTALVIMMYTALAQSSAFTAQAIEQLNNLKLPSKVTLSL